MHQNERKGKAPFAVVTTLAISTLFGAGAVSAEEADQQKPGNHGQHVSQTAHDKTKQAAANQQTGKTDKHNHADGHKGEQQTPASSWVADSYKDMAQDYRSLIDSYQSYISRQLPAAPQAPQQPAASKPVTDDETSKAPSAPQPENTVPVDTVNNPTTTTISETPEPTVNTPAQAAQPAAPAAPPAQAAQPAAPAASPVQTVQPAVGAPSQPVQNAAEIPAQPVAATATPADKADTENEVHTLNRAPQAVDHASEKAQKTVDQASEKVNNAGGNAAYEKLMGYYQNLVSAYQSFVSLLK